MGNRLFSSEDQPNYLPPSDREGSEAFDTIIDGTVYREVLKLKNVSREEVMHKRLPRLLEVGLSMLDTQFGKIRNIQKTNNKEGNGKLEAEHERNKEYIKLFFEEFLKSRLERAMEVMDPRVDEAREMLKALFGENNYNAVVTCMDGRNMPAVMFSNVPHGMGFLKKAAGTLPFFEVEYDENGNEVINILENTYIAQQIEALLVADPNRVIYYDMDSHLGCAARNATYQLCNRGAQDSGLAQDVGHKIGAFQALLVFREQLLKEGKKVSEIRPSLFSYDPHDGYIWGGFKCHLNDPRVVAEGFSEKVRNELLAEKKVFSTEEMMSDKKIKALLAKSVKHTADFRTNYAESLHKNWVAITELYDNGEGELFGIILDRVSSAYTNSGWRIGEPGEADDLLGQVVSQDVLIHQAKKTLLNLVSRYSVAGAGHDWPFANHEEAFLVVHEGGYPPFDGPDAFGIFSHSDLPKIVEQIKLAQGLVRTLRKGDNYPKHVDMDMTKEELEAAPVMVANKAVNRRISEEGWEAIEAIPQEKMEAFFGQFKWRRGAALTPDAMKNKIKKELLAGVKIDFDDGDEFINSISEIYERMHYITTATASEDLRDLVQQGSLVMMNLVLDGDRMPRVILPFIV